MKKILAFTLALAMVLSTATMTFAASKEVEALANLKLLLNTTDAEVNADLNRAVGLAMVLKALGYTQEDANAKAEANTFVDMEKYGWAKGFTVLGEELKITNGTSVEPKMFSPSAKLNERAFVAFMLRALGYDVDAAWAKAGEIAKEAGVAETVTENKLTKGEAAVIMYKALMAKVQGDEKGRTLAQKLVDEKKLDKDLAVANGLISGEPEKLTVTAMADNLIEVTVSFDGTVDKETAEKTGNYKVKGATVEKAMVQEGGRTVVLRLAKALSNKAEHQLTVSGVKNVAGNVMDKQVVKFATNDVTAPAVEKVTITGPKSFEVTYSEPIAEKGTASLLLGKNTITAKDKEIKSNDRVVVYEVLSSFREGKEYTLRLGDGKTNDKYAKDFAKYTAPYYEETFTYAKDTTAPEVKVLKASQTEVTLEFTKPVTGITTDHFYHTFKSYTPVQLKDEKGKVLTAENAKKERTQVTLVFFDGNKNNHKNHPFNAGEVVLTVLGKDGSNKIKDNWGNELQNVDLTLTITADREAPEVVSAEATGEKEVKVTFSEEMNEKLLKNRDNYVFTDKDNKKVNVKNVVAEEGNKVAKITLDGNQAGKTLTLVVKNMRDASIYENAMAEYTTTLDFSDKTLKDVKEVYYKADDDKKVYKLFVVYGEDMDESVLEMSNFKVKKDGKYEDLKGDAEFLEGTAHTVVVTLPYDKDGDNKLIKFIAPTMSVVDAAKKPYLVISQKVKDLAGNNYTNFETPFEIKNYSNSTTLDKLEAVAVDKIVVEFKNDLVSLSEDGFEVKADAKKIKIVEFNQVNAKKYELVLEENIRTSAEAVTVQYTAQESDLDIFGYKPSNKGATQVTDKIAPAIAVIKYEEGASQAPVDVYTEVKSGNEADKGKPAILVKSADGKAATVEVKFTEKVKKSSIATTTFKVNNGWEIESFVMADDQDTVTFNLKAKSEEDWDGLNDLMLSQVSAFKDMESNSSAVASSMDTFFANTAKVRAVGNIVVKKGAENKTATVTITFNKDVNLDSISAATFTLVGAANYEVKEYKTKGTSKQVVLDVVLKSNQAVNEDQLNALTLTHAENFKDAAGLAVATGDNILTTAPVPTYVYE